jgi:membrane dipeptidase
MTHFEYCAELVGIEHLAFGPDTHFGDHVAWHRAFAGGASTPYAPSATEYVDGAENPAEAIRNITRWLVKHDYSEIDIARVLGGNIMGLLSVVWPS